LGSDLVFQALNVRVFDSVWGPSNSPQTDTDFCKSPHQTRESDKKEKLAQFDSASQANSRSEDLAGTCKVGDSVLALATFETGTHKEVWLSRIVTTNLRRKLEIMRLRATAALDFALFGSF